MAIKNARHTQASRRVTKSTHNSSPGAHIHTHTHSAPLRPLVLDKDKDEDRHNMCLAGAPLSSAALFS